MVAETIKKKELLNLPLHQSTFNLHDLKSSWSNQPSTVWRKCSCDLERIFKALDLFLPVESAEIMDSEDELSVKSELYGANYSFSEKSLCYDATNETLH